LQDAAIASVVMTEDEPETETAHSSPPPASKNSGPAPEEETNEEEVNLSFLTDGLVRLYGTLSHVCSFDEQTAVFETETNV
jgi:hypothetical protein